MMDRAFSSGTAVTLPSLPAARLAASAISRTVRVEAWVPWKMEPAGARSTRRTYSSARSSTWTRGQWFAPSPTVCEAPCFSAVPKNEAGMPPRAPPYTMPGRTTTERMPSLASSSASCSCAGRQATIFAGSVGRDSSTMAPAVSPSTQMPLV